MNMGFYLKAVGVFDYKMATLPDKFEWLLFGK